MPKFTIQEIKTYIAKCKEIIPVMTEDELHFAMKRVDHRVFICPIDKKQILVPIHRDGKSCNLLSILSEADLTIKDKDADKYLTCNQDMISYDNIIFLNDSALRYIAKCIIEIQTECRKKKEENTIKIQPDPENITEDLSGADVISFRRG